MWRYGDDDDDDDDDDDTLLMWLNIYTGTRHTLTWRHIKVVCAVHLDHFIRQQNMSISDGMPKKTNPPS